MSERVLVPIYRLDVSYIVRHGRRWSALEHLILWACEQPASAHHLAQQADVPVRLVSECLVNLLRVGWVEFREAKIENVFVTTAAGRAEAAKLMPDHQLETQIRTTQLYMERLCGEFFSVKELTVIRRDTPDFRSVETIDPELFTAAPLGPELVDRLLLRRDDSFDRLKEAPHVVPGDLFAALDVDATGIHGLPSRTPASVGLAVLEALKVRQLDATLRGHAPPALPPMESALGDPLKVRGSLVPFKFQPDDLIVGGPEHLAAAKEVIGKARRFVVVHSTFVGRNLRELLPALKDAAIAGTQVYLYWGRTDDPEKIEPNPSEAAARMAVREIPADARANIHLGIFSTGSHAKVILADTGQGNTCVAMVSSCNWLDSPYRSVEASVRFTEPALIAMIAQRLAALVAPAIGQDLVVGQLLDVHSRSAAQPATVSIHTAMLVTDQDHYAAVRDAMNETGRGGTVLLGSHKFGHAAETTVLDPMRAAAARRAVVRLFYTKVLPNLGEARAAEKRAELSAAAIDLRNAAEEMHAKFIAWGSTLVVTSFNFLSASGNASRRSGSEIGILLEGPGVVAAFEQKLEAHGVLAETAAGTPARRKHKRRRRQSAAAGAQRPITPRGVT